MDDSKLIDTPPKRPNNQPLLNRMRLNQIAMRAEVHQRQVRRVADIVEPLVFERRPKPALPQRPPSRFKVEFSAERLRALADTVDRGKVLGFGKGMGEFEDVLDAAASLTNSTGDQQAQAIENVIAQVNGYCDVKRKAAYEKEKDSGAKGDRRTIAKYEAAQSMLREARRLKEDPINAAYAQRDDASSAQRVQQRQGHAAALAQAFGAKKSSAGSSDVQLIKNADNKVAYAFKSIEGETKQTTMEPGGATMRELMSSAVASEIYNQSGLDFGFPTVTMASLDGKPGALIEGLSGDCFDVDGSRKELALGERTQAETTKMRNEWTERAKAMPAKELQKVLLCGLAMGNFDVKWGNLMVEADGSARPFDAGTAFPTDCDMASAIARDVIPINLTMAPDGADLASAKEPMDPALVAQFMQINAASLRRATAQARDRIAQDSGLDAGLVDDTAIERAIHSIEIIQDILTQTPQISMADFAVAYGARMRELCSPQTLQLFNDIDAEDVSLINRKPREFAAELKRRMAAQG